METKAETLRGPHSTHAMWSVRPDRGSEAVDRKDGSAAVLVHSRPRCPFRVPFLSGLATSGRVVHLGRAAGPLLDGAMIIRDSRSEDIPSIAAIYGHWVRHGGHRDRRPPSLSPVTS